MNSLNPKLLELSVNITMLLLGFSTTTIASSNTLGKKNIPTNLNRD